MFGVMECYRSTLDYGTMSYAPKHLPFSNQ